MKLRINRVKREHSTIKNIISILEKIAHFPGVKAVIPGRIKPIRGSYPNPIIEFKVLTYSGFKCIAKSDRAVQEVFVICDKAENVLEELKRIKIIM